MKIPPPERTVSTPLITRVYGNAGATAVVLHGGPGAPGSVADMAGELSHAFRVFEPWQRHSGAVPLTVARHVEDLHQLVRQQTEAPPAIVGHSWGAMLALAYASAYPESAGPLVLVGCGTFDPQARQKLEQTRNARMTAEQRDALQNLLSRAGEGKAAVRRIQDLLQSVDSYDEIAGTVESEDIEFDFEGHSQTWQDMIRLQEQGVYPAAFQRIASPVLMMHGAYDPHPGREICAGLKKHIPRLEYREWGKCGHYPWREKAVRTAFYTFLKRWLAAHTDVPGTR